MFVRNFIAICVLSCSLPIIASAASIDSIYTDLSSNRCKTIEIDKETGDSVRKCPGVAGYSLLVQDFDGRESVTVLTADGQRHSLNYHQVITRGGFSSLAQKAEWRVTRRKGKVLPRALIVRVNANESTSYLAVAKIAAEKVCVTQKVEGGAKANEEARRAADISAQKPCLE
ncbi:hypothetical protein DSM106972_044500 [Dulcicalothrix desertica PCC 7102]|uniref:Uncharacterized protein n=1 Tax=Dulcicalothrix desertica PCC 7102 TaxID=232991 RepID=A0A433VDN3_9CYAN|nr:hypothetical protein [Dulcicalothrix desertica]RUT04222.1 hypothetical protein DSM106972_044500 [Dulcicalothrix desertica PCC 7102]TWH51475.1 hypothetical protein CAL7102_05897 [Dulcicalothrix desertica PCC 7102]